MITLEEFDKIVGESWAEIRKETEVYGDLFKQELRSDQLALDDPIFELEGNLSHSIYYHLRKKLVDRGVFPEIFLNVQSVYPIEGGPYNTPDIMVLNKNEPWVVIELKCRSRANLTERGGITPSLPKVEEDIIKISKYHSHYNLERAYLFLFSKKPWSAIRPPKKTHREAINALKNAHYLRIGYGFYVDEKWGFWNFPFNGYPHFLKI